MVCLTLPPYVLSRAIDEGLRPGSRSALVGWAAALFGVGVLNAWLAIMRHRTMTRIRLDAYVRTVRVVVDHTTRLGATLPRRMSAGEVVTIGHSDVGVIGQTLTVTGPGIGAVLAYVVVAALLLSISVPLALVVLLGVPLLSLLLGPLLSRLQGAETAYRDRQGTLAALLGDLAGGLRVLNGLGGKGVFAARYRAGSRELRDEGYRVGSTVSWIQALGVGLPTLFLAAVTWLAARMAAQGTITVGELVAVYGYVAVLVVPVSSLIESGYDIGRGLVAARRVVDFLNLEPERWSAGGGAQGAAERRAGVEVGARAGKVAEHRADAEARALADGGDDAASLTSTGTGDGAGDGAGENRARPVTASVLRDPLSGVEVAPGILTALVSPRAADGTEVVDRLGRFVPSQATWGTVPLSSIPPDEVRARILVADNEADLFAGTLRTVISGRHTPDEDSLARAVGAAVARDIVLGLPDGLDSSLDAHGSNLSGGQRQRIRLARALLADPEILLAVDPTSAVDAHTEARMAAGLRAARTGRTTLVTTASPLVLDQADVVYYLIDGEVAATGRHTDLLTVRPDYRRLVSRGTDDTTEQGSHESHDSPHPSPASAPLTPVPPPTSEPAHPTHPIPPTHEALR